MNYPSGNFYLPCRVGSMHGIGPVSLLGFNGVDFEAAGECADYFGWISETPLAYFYEGVVTARFPFEKSALGGCLRASSEDCFPALF